MAELKTKKTTASVADFIAAIADHEQRADSKALVKMMKAATKAQPKMWGPSIVGFGDLHYKYATGREGDWFMCGFSPRKGQMSVYIMPALTKHKALLDKLGKYKTGVSCLYIRRLSDVDLGVLAKLVAAGVDECKKMKRA